MVLKSSSRDHIFYQFVNTRPQSFVRWLMPVAPLQNPPQPSGAVSAACDRAAARVCPPAASRTGRPSAFTLIELIVVVAMVGILASLLLPALARAKTQARVAGCLKNNGQLQMAWLMYAHDNGDNLVGNDQTATGAGWVWGVMNFDGNNSDNTNFLNLTDPKYSALAPYLGKVASIYKCPEDRSEVVIKGTSYPRARSVALSEAMNSRDDWLGAVTGLSYMVFRRIADINRISPAQALCFIDEHPDSVNYGDFAVAMVDQSSLSRAKIIDVPASLHNGSCGVSLADGHAEIHRWQDERTRKPVQYAPPAINVYSSPGNFDCLWLAEHVSVLK
jgi:prepilin-type N-terminal cleavage/methylation domain-containing protein/prepilin-type processing-associated H-X9-DG protein